MEVTENIFGVSLVFMSLLVMLLLLLLFTLIYRKFLG